MEEHLVAKSVPQIIEKASEDMSIFINTWFSELVKTPFYDDICLTGSDIDIKHEGKDYILLFINTIKNGDSFVEKNFIRSKGYASFYELIRKNMSSAFDYEKLSEEQCGPLEFVAKKYLSFSQSLKRSMVLYYLKFFHNKKLVLESGILQSLDLADQFQMALMNDYLARQHREMDIAEARIDYLNTNLAKDFSVEGFVGQSEKMKNVFILLGQVIQRDVTVLLQGESGTGKDVLARLIHMGSHRKDSPFIVVNCGAIPHNLIESELFGHEKGSFTDAVESKPGKFELAHNGTLFLDEIGDLSQEAQTKLLRVLQNKVIERVGGKQPLPVDVRVIAATNKNLSEEVEKENFRLDLFYRVNVFPITLPPLRERLKDIPLLAAHFIERYSKEYNKEVRDIDSGALDLLNQYQWPGNVRELENIIMRAVILSPQPVVSADIVRLALYGFKEEGAVALLSEPSTETVTKERIKPETIQSLEDVEKDHIIFTLKKVRFNIKKASEILGVSRVTLYKKIEDYGIKRE
ncbi:sigma-54 interaction domain-containing protein [Candidatus Margulisiibacteriota bacterium]